MSRTKLYFGFIIYSQIHNATLQLYAPSLSIGFFASLCLAKNPAKHPKSWHSTIVAWEIPGETVWPRNISKSNMTKYVCPSVCLSDLVSICQSKRCMIIQKMSKFIVKARFICSYLLLHFVLIFACSKGDI